jgi:tRNA (mo5U34)-methyltransferase
MQNPESEAVNRQFDAEYFNPKMALFERTYNPQNTEKRIASLGDRFAPHVEITMADIVQKYPYYLKLLVDHPQLEQMVATYADRLRPFLQCPFPVAGGRVLQGAWVGEYKLANFPKCDVTAETVANKRVLDLGCNAGYDTFYLSTLGPSEIIGVEPAYLFYYQALFLWSTYYCPNLRFLNTEWQNIRKETLGTFDVINCQGVLYHEPSPMLLVEALFDLLEPGGTLVLESHVTLDDDLKAQFIEGTFYETIDWWWTPSIPTIKAMLAARGFEDIVVRSWGPAPSNNPDDPEHTVEGLAPGGRAFFTARRPKSQYVSTPKYVLDRF